MKTMVLTTAAGATPSLQRTPSSAGRHRPGAGGGGGDSCYFPGCRKDANCHCEMCLASIHATRDLIPSGSAMASRPPARRALALADDLVTPPSTPEARLLPFSPPTESTAKSRMPPSQSPVARKNGSWGTGYLLLGLLAGLALLWALDSGVLAAMSREMGPKLTPEAVKQFDSPAFAGDLKGRLESLQRKIKNVVGRRVCDCSSLDSNWELIQDGNIFFHWRCVIYKSVAEEVSVWGSPLRTSGLFPISFSARSLTLLSGRMIEWSEGGVVSTSRSGNCSSWVSKQWSSAAVQLEANTWVLEYKRSAIFQVQGLLPSVWEMLRMKATRTVKKLKQEPWRLLPLSVNPELEYCRSEENQFIHPT